MNKACEILTELEGSNKLKELVNGGIISPCVIHRLTLYRYIDARVKTGSKVTEAVKEAEVHFNVCAQTVYTAIKTFRKNK